MKSKKATIIGNHLLQNEKVNKRRSRIFRRKSNVNDSIIDNIVNHNYYRENYISISKIQTSPKTKSLNLNPYFNGYHFPSSLIITSSKDKFQVDINKINNNTELDNVVENSCICIPKLNLNYDDSNENQLSFQINLEKKDEICNKIKNNSFKNEENDILTKKYNTLESFIDEKKFKELESDQKLNKLFGDIKISNFTDDITSNNKNSKYQNNNQIIRSYIRNINNSTDYNNDSQNNYLQNNYNNSYSDNSFQSFSTFGTNEYLTTQNSSKTYYEIDKSIQQVKGN